MDEHKKLRRGKRRRMTKFVMGELSAVDYPAQAGARATIVKRRDDGLAKLHVLELPDDLAPEDRAELADMATRIGRTEDAAAAGLLHRLFAARLAQPGVTVRDIADDAADLEEMDGAADSDTVPASKAAGPRAVLARLLA